MTERPKPPKPHKTWLDWCVAPPIDGHGVEPKEIARAELEELQEKAALAGKCQRCQALLHIRCPDCAGVREPP